MSTKGELSRDQAVAIVGEESVAKVERENCEASSRLMPDHDDRVEFVASIWCQDSDGEKCSLRAYYYPTQQELDDTGDDLSNVNWEIEGYEVI